MLENSRVSVSLPNSVSHAGDGIILVFLSQSKMHFFGSCLMLSHKNEHITAENVKGLPHCVKKYLRMHV